ncbi:MAG TPA: hypothetical protein PLS69_02620 [Terricaulis sp.]|nr:hypothetical protein [Terricaulis sp.]HRP09876.1 hypothetical protein [Terricaulis sp.]
MRIATLLGAAASAALLAACGLGAPAYPSFGEADYRIEGITRAADGSTTPTTIYRDGPKMRVEATLPNIGQGAVVFDESTNSAYVLNPTGQAQAPATPATAPTPEGAAPPAQPAATASAPAPALGVAVRVDDANAPKPMEAAWSALGADNARHVGRCSVAGEDGNEWRPRDGDTGVRTACITSDGIVLRVTQEGAVLWEATALQRGDQDPALFGVPAGYQVIDPQAVAAQVGETLEELDSVTGAPPPPQQAPAPRG